MTAVGLGLLGIGITLILSGFRGDNPWEVAKATFTGKDRPDPQFRIATAAAGGGGNALTSAAADMVAAAGPPSGQIVKAAGINVDSSIAAQVTAMVQAAAADGVKLSGGGYRSAADQIRLRKAHCGAAWQTAPASSCRPPTAKPGQSMHEKGLAIDFQNCSSRSTPCFQWLSRNAARFGFKNLPSEPWHWSVNGK